MLLPVPLHRSGRREYIQSLLLAKGISLMWSIPVKDDVLYWRIEMGSQTGKKRISRDMMPANAMEASKSLEGLSVGLVDDVYTTGNTMRTAISAVQRAGGRVASALVWSRRIPSQENEAAWQDVAETSI